MKTSNIPFIAIAMAAIFAFSITSCGKDAIEESFSVLEEGTERYEELRSNSDFIEVPFPSEQDPGPPFYARVFKWPETELILEVDGKVFIPFIRQLACVDPDFNLLEFFHVPDAFFCPLSVAGSGLIEPDAPLGTFPAIAFAEGDNVEMWIVEKSALDAAMANGTMTIADLDTLQPLKGFGKYAEYNVPRTELGHLLVIEAGGTIASTNQNFTFTYVERNYQQVSISLIVN